MNNVPADDIAVAETELASTPVELVERWPRAMHFWGWLACVAVCLFEAFFSLYDKYGWMFYIHDFFSPYIGPHVVSYFLWAVSGGGALFGLGLFFAKRRRAIEFPKTEGEFLLLALGSGTLLYLVLDFLPKLVIGDEASLWANPNYFFAGYFVAVVITLLVLFFCWKRAAFWWRLFFFLELISVVVNVQTRWRWRVRTWEDEPEMTFIFSVLTLIPAVALTGVAFLDWRRKNELSWAHWLGIGVYLVGYVSSILTRRFYLMWPHILSNWPF